MDGLASAWLTWRLGDSLDLGLCFLGQPFWVVRVSFFGDPKESHHFGSPPIYPLPEGGRGGSPNSTYLVFPITGQWMHGIPGVIFLPHRHFSSGRDISAIHFLWDNSVGILFGVQASMTSWSVMSDFSIKSLLLPSGRKALIFNNFFAWTAGVQNLGLDPPTR